MNRIRVQKFGGTSVGSIDRIQKVAEWVLDCQLAGSQVVVVVSAMSGETNRLVALAEGIRSEPFSREYDMLLASGEQVSVALLSLAINTLAEKKGCAFRAKPFLGYQLGIQTDRVASKARIQSIDAAPLHQAIQSNLIPVIAGFQGVDCDQAITTLGRGGSDTSAIAIAAAVGATECEIYTDVDGVYTTDPRLCPQARKMQRISYEEMMELASLGAKVLQIRSVELASKYQIPIHVRSSFEPQEGTRVMTTLGSKEGMESVVVAGIAADRAQVRFSLQKLPHRLTTDAKVFHALAEAAVVVDIIVKELPKGGVTSLSFTASDADAETANRVLQQLKYDAFPEMEIEQERSLAKVSIVGVGMQHHPGVASKMFQILAEQGIEIKLISTSEIKVSCMIPGEAIQKAVSSLHHAFGLDTSLST